MINIKAYANADDVLIAWQPDKWSGDWAASSLSGATIPRNR